MGRKLGSSRVGIPPTCIAKAGLELRSSCFYHLGAMTTIYSHAWPEDFDCINFLLVAGRG